MLDKEKIRLENPVPMYPPLMGPIIPPKGKKARKKFKEVARRLMEEELGY